MNLGPVIPYTTIMVLISAFKEISNRILNDTTITHHINEIIIKHTQDFVQIKRCNIFKIGMLFKIRISFSSEFIQHVIQNLVEAQQKIVDGLSKTFSSLELNYKI